MKIAVPVYENSGLDSPVSENFLIAPYIVILSQKGDEIEVKLYKNVAKSDRDIAEMLLAYGVQKVIYLKASNRVRIAFQELNLEIVNGNFGKLSDVLNYVFPSECP